MTRLSIAVNDRIYLSELRPSDRGAFVESLNDRDIYDRTLTIPSPYTEADAENYLAIVAEATAKHGHPASFAIRDDHDQLIGGCGFGDLTSGHHAEIGYWLASPFRRRGIMTDVVRAACQFAATEWQLVRITAHIFAFNVASARVLEKSGFHFEGYLRKYHKKDDAFLDSRLYALVR